MADEDLASLALAFGVIFVAVFMAFSASESVVDFELGRLYANGDAGEQTLAVVLADTLRAWIENVLRVLSFGLFGLCGGFALQSPCDMLRSSRTG
ncbi:MAG: hypothetical protein U5Q44_02685 [Dehalococcoidia bacterium]|nr:hypothetical protein [Dehalococcoidia bacterium]